MNLLFIKIVAIPLMLWIVMLVTRRFGSFAGGVVGGLPLTSATISFFMAIEQGPEFAYKAAWGAFQGIVSYVIFGVLLVHLSQRYHWTVAFISSIVGFFLTAWLVANTPVPAFIWIAISALAIVVATKTLPASNPQSQPMPVTQLKKPPYLQMVSGSLLTVFITALANLVGPTYSGIFLFFPIIAGVLSVYMLRNQYFNAIIHFYEGAFVGKFTGWTFMLVLLLCLPHCGIVLAYGLGVLAACLISVLNVKPLLSKII